MAYIDKDKAIAYVEEQYRLFDNDENKQAIVEGCVEALKFTPTADVVEVVRCKDCKHAKAKEYYGCACQNRNTPWFNDEFEVYMNFNDFCSFAERKDT